MFKAVMEIELVGFGPWHWRDHGITRKRGGIVRWVGWWLSEEGCCTTITIPEPYQGGQGGSE